MGLNLPAAPAGFRGLQPDVPVVGYWRRLPHWRQVGATYAVTMRLADSLPHDKIEWLFQAKSHLERTAARGCSTGKRCPTREDERWSRTVARYLEKWLDAGYGECLLRQACHRATLHDSLLHFHRERYDLSGFVIMPNHCHAVIRPFRGEKLEALLGVIKGFAARGIQSSLGRTGQLWEEETYDRIVRDEDHLYLALRYLAENPRRANLPPHEAEVWFDPSWIEQGWGWKTEWSVP